MILKGNTPLKVGSVQRGARIQDGDGNWHLTPFMVLEEVTAADWIEYATAVNPNRYSEAQIRAWAAKAKYFYRISVD